jgi:uncharacterized repeat protein (TIGR01451 family)
VSAREPDPVPANNTASASTTVSGVTPAPELADLAMGKTGSAGGVPPGGQITYALTATNRGPNPARDVTIQDETPPGTAFVAATPSAGGSCTAPAAGGAGTVTCVWPGLTAIGPGDARTVALVLAVSLGAENGTSVLNIARASGATPDPEPANNTAFALTAILNGGPTADIAVQKVLVPESPPGGQLTVGLGQTVTFWVKVMNLGSAPATGVVVADLLPPGLAFVSAALTQGSFDAASGVWTVGALPVEGMAVLDLTVRVTELGSMQNTAARLHSQPPDPNADNDVSVVSFDVIAPGLGGRFVTVGNVDGQGPEEIVTGAGEGESPQVRVFRPDGTDTGLAFLAFAPGLLGGVRVASCDVTGDGVAEILAAAGPGGEPRVRVFAVADGAVATELTSFLAFELPGCDSPCIFAPVTPAATMPGATITLHRSTVRPSRPLIVGLSAQNPAGGEPLDVYAGVLLPDRETLAFFSADGNLAGGASIGTPANFIRAGVLAPGRQVSRPSFLVFTVPASGIPPGTYQLFVALVRAGAFADGRIDPGDIAVLDVKPLTVTP